MREPHRIEADDDDLEGVNETRTLAYIHSASPESVRTVLDAAEGEDDGRSEWVWCRLPNGDLILGIFPHGDTYFAVEGDAFWDGPAR